MAKKSSLRTEISLSGPSGTAALLCCRRDGWLFEVMAGHVEHAGAKPTTRRLQASSSV
jgi:hypothetical protein